ncbi:MAG: hypothetical protein ABSB01_14275 [Streptosporangiaceae bacterium]|jgi:ABC-type uncharacterized transport system permease subunit
MLATRYRNVIMGGVLAGIGHLLAMAPYLATIIVVAGLAGNVRAPRADGKPSVKA